MLADPGHESHPTTTIDKAFEGSDETTFVHCYISNPWGKTRAILDFPPSKVYQIEFLHRGDCCADPGCCSKSNFV